MEKNFRSNIIFIFIVTLCLFGACNKAPMPEPAPERQDKSIVILYDNDVHCGIDGYARIAGLRDEINRSDTAECIIVSCGDYLQGSSYGVLSGGQYIVDIMNSVGYSAATIGNHEFDYGTDRLLEVMQGCNIPLTCVNFSKNGSTKQYYKPYVMTEVAGKKIAFVGILTPSTQTSEYYSFYDGDILLYDLYPNLVFDLVQKAVDDARAAGADYVIALSHLGEKDYAWTSPLLINSTTGIDQVLDGHTHSVIADSTAVSLDGKTVHFTQTGTQFSNIGKLTISRSGVFHTELLPTAGVTYSSSRVAAVCDSVKVLVSAITDEKLGTSDYALKIYDDAGNRIVRKAECTAGDFVADAFRYCMGTEIALVNGGGVRADLPAGDVTYGDIINVNPFFNDMEAREVTGSQLRLFLGECYSLLPGENGSFMQVSGLKVNISLAGGSPVITGITVENSATGEYEPLDDGRTYTVGSTTYVFGLSQALSSCKLITPLIIKDTEALRQYFVSGLSGSMGELYRTTSDRICIFTGSNSSTQVTCVL